MCSDGPNSLYHTHQAFNIFMSATCYEAPSSRRSNPPSRFLSTVFRTYGLYCPDIDNLYTRQIVPICDSSPYAVTRARFNVVQHLGARCILRTLGAISHETICLSRQYSRRRMRCSPNAIVTLRASSTVSSGMKGGDPK